MTIGSELTTLNNSIDAIKTSIRNQGQSVSAMDTLASFDDKILNIDNVKEHTVHVLPGILNNDIEEINDSQSTILRTHGFHNLTMLRKATFSNIIKICPFAFQNCFRLKALFLNVNRVVELPSLSAFRYTPLEKLNGEIFVPAAYWDIYKAHDKWGYFTDILKPIGTAIVTTGIDIIIPSTLPSGETYQFM